MKTTTMIYRLFLMMIYIQLICLSNANAQLPADYKGKPYEDKFYKKGAQVIPGKVEAAYYDIGGEGVAYHDKDSINNASVLNWQQKCPPSGGSSSGDYICHFREHEAVDVSYTKDLSDFIDPNFYEPPVNQFYIGWTAAGEWVNFTVNVRTAGKYKITALYGGNNDNKSSFWINNVKATDIKLPMSTGSMHKWNKAEVGTIIFPAVGLNLLTLKYNGGANLAYFEFELVEKIK